MQKHYITSATSGLFLSSVIAESAFSHCCLPFVTSAIEDLTSLRIPALYAFLSLRTTMTGYFKIEYQHMYSIKMYESNC